MNKPKVVITKMSRRWNCFQHFILGFYELERKGIIDFQFRCDWITRISTVIPNIPFLKRMLYSCNVRMNEDLYNMEGYVEKEGKKFLFCIDSADAPFLFDSQTLKEVDCYFKMQCPKEFPEEGFRLTDGVVIPWCDQHRYKSTEGHTERRPHVEIANYVHKIQPCTVGFRQLANTLHYRDLKAGYENYKQGINSSYTKKLMCYFGNALGPVAIVNKECPDWDSESQILGYYGNQVEHPNVKRAKVAHIMQKKGSLYDARVISEGNADSGAIKHEELIVPLKDFCAFVSESEYNLNISGYRMSIPNRFMESFIVGTAILTDKLAVKWYLPFEEEVKETVEMGYLPDDKVDYKQVERDIDTLPTVSRKRMLELYERKWSPEAVAAYMVETCLSYSEKSN